MEMPADLTKEQLIKDLLALRRRISELEELNENVEELKRTKAMFEVGPLPSVTCDPNQLRQLFQNLISNSLKYHRPGVKTIIKIYGEKDNGRCRISVEDNGIGFDQNHLEKIFQPFQRLHGRTEYPGIGMGLAVCKKIVERHGGAITASSNPGKGSTFIVTLPPEQKK